MAKINIFLLALGSFPIEIALAMAGIALSLVTAEGKLLRQYFLVLAAAFLLFVAVFKARLPASLVFARYLLPFVVFLLPFAAYFLFRLLKAPRPWRNEAAAATCVVILATATLDFGRAFNYPAMFPKDAIGAGWTVRNLQEAGSLSDRSKVLIERSPDWGDLAIVVIANRPERFVLINEIAYQQLSSLGRADRPALSVSADSEGVRGTGCDHGFQVEACKLSVLREEFSLVILSSPGSVQSFRDTFHAPSWNVGRYEIFDISSLKPSGARG